MLIHFCKTQTNRAETTLQQRLIWQETQENFFELRAIHRRMLVNHYEYFGLFA